MQGLTSGTTEPICAHSMPFLLSHLAKFMPGRSPSDVAVMWHSLTNQQTQERSVNQTRIPYTFKELKMRVVGDFFACICQANTVLLKNLRTGKEKTFFVDDVCDIVICGAETVYCANRWNQIYMMSFDASNPELVGDHESGQLKRLGCNYSIDAFFIAVYESPISTTFVKGHDAQTMSFDTEGSIISMSLHNDDVVLCTALQTLIVNGNDVVITINKEFSYACLGPSNRLVTFSSTDGLTLYAIIDNAVYPQRNMPELCQKICHAEISSDGSWVAFCDASHLWLCSLTNASVQTLAESMYQQSGVTFTWIPDSNFLVTARDADKICIYKCSLEGTETVSMTQLPSQSVKALFATRTAVFVQMETFIQIIQFDTTKLHTPGL